MYMYIHIYIYIYIHTNMQEYVAPSALWTSLLNRQVALADLVLC